MGDFSTADRDNPGDSRAYSLVSGVGDADNGSFAIDGFQLKTARRFDYETTSSWSIRVRTMDLDGLWIEKDFNISVIDVNETATDIGLSSMTVAENGPIGTTVGRLSTADPDGGDTFTYSLVTGTGDADNGSFAIDGDQLKTAESFDFEAKRAYGIRVRSTDQGGLWTEKAFTINVTDVPEVSLANTTSALLEDTNTTTRIKVANIVVTDDASGVNTLSLGGADASLFEVEPVSGTGAFGAVLYLKAGAGLDFETNPVLDVTVRVDDPAVGVTPDDTADLAISVVPVLEGTVDNDVFVFVAGPAGSWTVNLNGIPHYFGPEVKDLRFNGLEGQDTAMIAGTASNETVELWPGHGTLVGEGYRVAIGNVETVAVDGGGGVDVAFLHDDPDGKDTFTGDSNRGTLSGDGYENQVASFRYVHVYGTAGNADAAFLHGDPNARDTFEAGPDEAKLSGGTRLTFLLRARSCGSARNAAISSGSDLVSTGVFC